MSVGDQIAIEAAMNRFADTLEKRGETAQDTLLASLARIMGRLGRLNGREGTLTVTLPGVPSPLEMKAIALYSEDAATVGAAPHLNVIIAWEGLDNGAMTFRRALMVGADGETPEGTFPILAASETDAARFVDFSLGAPADFYFNVGGTLTVTDHDFPGTCPGLPSSGPLSCRSGSETVGASLTLSRDDGATMPTLSWAAGGIPAYRVTAGSTP
jgi:hypothetical protein